jgi:hypothetical protein
MQPPSESEFMHKVDFVHARPLADWLIDKPEHVVDVVLAKPGEDYVAYLADSREVKEAAAGAPISGQVSFRLPAGAYRASLFSPVSGKTTDAGQLKGGNEQVVLPLPAFEHDMVLRVTREP